MSFASDIGRMVAHGPLRPMNEEESVAMVRIVFMAEAPQEVQIDLYRMMLEKSLCLRIIDQRFRANIGTDIPFSPPMIMWLSTLAGGNPGHAVLMVAVLAYLHAEGRELTLNSLTNHYFSVGIPSDANLQLAWNGQKVNEDRLKSLNITRRAFGDNMLDYDEAWK